jgi:hypothetical protein
MTFVHMYDRYKHILKNSNWNYITFKEFNDEMLVANYEKRLAILKFLKKEDLKLKIERCLK